MKINEKLREFEDSRERKRQEMQERAQQKAADI